MRLVRVMHSFLVCCSCIFFMHVAGIDNATVWLACMGAFLADVLLMAIAYLSQRWM